MQKKTLDDANLSDRFIAIADSKMDGGKVYDYALEGLRGLAAIWVAYSHIFFFEFNLDPAYHPVFPFGTFFNAAHGGILIFFALSGYVIGLTNQLPFSRSNAIRYLLRRFIRLYPIYVVAIALGVLSSAAGSWKTIVGSLFFLPPVIAGLLPGNGVLWTLHYEVVYYILFLSVWYFCPKVSPLMIGALIVSCIPIAFPTSPLFLRMISGYAAGWVFWLFGLWLAWKKPRTQDKIKFPLFSYILLYIATDKLAIGVVALNDLGLVTTKLSEISVTDFVYFPLCMLLFTSLTQRKLPHLRWWMMVAIAIPLVHTMYLLTSGKLVGNEATLIAVAHMILGFALLPWKISPGIFIYLDFFGSISYGIYVFHMPILNFMSKFSLFSGSPITFIIRALMWAGLTIGISCIFELIMQPLVKQRFNQKILKNI